MLSDYFAVQHRSLPHAANKIQQNQHFAARIQQSSMFFAVFNMLKVVDTKACQHGINKN